MAIEKLCTDTAVSTGLACETGNSLAVETGIHLALDDQEFSTVSSFATEADWITAIRQEKIFPISDVIEVQPDDEEAQYYTSPKGDQIPLRDGKYRARYLINVPLCLHARLQALKNAKLRLYKADDAGNLIGYTPDGTVVKGVQIGRINPEKMIRPAADTVAWTPIYIQEKDASQFNQNPVVVNPTWDISSLAGLVPVTIEVIGTPNATTIVLGVYAICGYNADGTQKKVSITGLVTADFSILTAAGAAQNPTFVDNGDGTYTGTDTDLETGTANLVDPDSLADTDALYKSTGATSFTVT